MKNYAYRSIELVSAPVGEEKSVFAWNYTQKTTFTNTKHAQTMGLLLFLLWHHEPIALKIKTSLQNKEPHRQTYLLPLWFSHYWGN